MEGSRIPSAQRLSQFTLMAIHRLDRLTLGSYADRQLSLFVAGSSRAFPPHPARREPVPDGLFPPPQPAGSDIGRPFARVLGEM